MADGASSAEDSPDDDSDFSRTCTTTGHRKRPDDDSDLGRTRTATGQKKHSLISQTAAQREERLAVERLQHIPFFITSYYYTCTLPYRVKRGKTERGVKRNTCTQRTITKQGINRTTLYCRTLRYNHQRTHACKTFGLTAYHHRNTAH